jgi:type IV pilus assembly protein PilB
MGLPPYNIASAVHLIMAQRLARRLCEKCKKELDIPPEALLKSGFREDQIDELKVFGHVGCDSCTGGYKGRVGIYQVMPISEEMGRLIMEGGNSMQLEKQAQAEGVADLRESGLKKVAAGITSLEEIDRVTKE